MNDLLFFIGCLSLGFIFEYVDSAFGGGYGTILTPVFMMLGYAPLEIVPVILLSETVTGFLGGVFHNFFRNVDHKVSWVLATFAVLGSFIGFSIAISAPKWAVKTYIGLLVIAMGLLMLRKQIKNMNPGNFSWKKIVFIGSLCGFNKSISGGGFGPVATSGLVLSGLGPKSAVGSTIFAEGLMSLACVILYEVLLKGLNWNIAIPLIIGASLATFPATYTTHKLPKRKTGLIISIFVISLGLAALIKAII